ncbi:MAG TPA: YeeE/YedE family protein [Hyphomicrobiaceae bacterium]|nr:YeeE/YedE family protein [Hyphomicrobiaceae bacterium]
MREAIAENGPLWLAIGGLVIGFVFGALVFRTNFCTMGSVSDIVNLGDWRRFRAWVLAAVVALAGAQTLHWLGVVDLTKSMYLGATFNWVGHVVGGWIFGFGMVFAGGCPSRNLARAGGGDLRALLTLVVVGIFAYMTIGGLIGPVRASIEQATNITLPTATQGIGDLADRALSLSAGVGRAAASWIVVLLGLAYCFKDAEFRSSPVHVISGIGVGLLVVAGWALTGLAFDDMAERPTAPISLTYVRPSGDALEWLQRYTAAPMPGFGVATVFGAILGAFVAAKAMGRFRLLTFSDVGDTVRVLLGAVLMGIGGVMALGCTVGQGITGVSTLAVGSFITFAAIVAGAVVGLKAFERWLMSEA